MCIEGATVLQANIMCVTHEYKNCTLLFIIDELISGSSLEGNAFFQKSQILKSNTKPWSLKPSTSGLVAM